MYSELAVVTVCTELAVVTVCTELAVVTVCTELAVVTVCTELAVVTVCTELAVVTVCTELAEEVRGHVTHTDNRTADIPCTEQWHDFNATRVPENIHVYSHL